jgi:branched-chain amino acid transport system permease protein
VRDGRGRAAGRRLRGDYLALVTLGFGEVVRYVLRNLEQVTNGTRGLGPLPLGPSPYFVNLAFLALVFVFLRRLEFARLGRAWVALREDELATTCMGISATKVKLSAFGLGAAIAGLGGALYASALGSTANPDAYDFSRSAITLCCVILGGLGSLRGALLGTFLLLGFDTMGTAFLKQHVFDVTDYRLGLFGLALILVMRFRPEGLWPSRRVRAELHEAEAA